MESIFVTDGDIQLILAPKDELERLFLTKLVDSGPLEFEMIRQPVGILGKSVKDAVIIRPKKTTSDSNETETL